MKPLDITGQRFGRLTAKSILDKGDRYGRFWLLVCDCGNTHEAQACNLRSQKVKSCGCLLSESIAKINTRHGQTSTKLWVCWCGIIQRTTNPKSKDYPNYGGRGITICDKWKSFEGFAEDMRPHPLGSFSIERIENDKGYSKDNCRWASKREQASNRRNSVVFEHGGKRLTLSEWSRESGIARCTLHLRLSKYGMDFSEAITRPVKKQRNNINSGLVVPTK